MLVATRIFRVILLAVCSCGVPNENKSGDSKSGRNTGESSASTDKDRDWGAQETLETSTTEKNLSKQDAESVATEVDLTSIAQLRLLTYGSRVSKLDTPQEGSYPAYEFSFDQGYSVNQLPVDCARAVAFATKLSDSVVKDADGNLHGLIRDGSGETRELWYVTCHEDKATITKLGELGAGCSCNAPTLALDSKGYAHILYSDGDLTYYVNNVNGTWTSQTIPWLQRGNVRSIAVDDQGGVHVVGIHGNGFTGSLLYITNRSNTFAQHQILPEKTRTVEGITISVPTILGTPKVLIAEDQAAHILYSESAGEPDGPWTYSNDIKLKHLRIPDGNVDEKGLNPQLIDEGIQSLNVDAAFGQNGALVFGFVTRNPREMNSAPEYVKLATIEADASSVKLLTVHDFGVSSVDSKGFFDHPIPVGITTDSDKIYVAFTAPVSASNKPNSLQVASVAFGDGKIHTKIVESDDSFSKIERIWLDSEQ